MLDQQWLIGSAEDCDLLIDAPTVSAHHCRLTRIGKQYFLEDCGSTNGTYCDGQPITAKTAVEPAAAITLGRSFPCPWPDSAGAKQVMFIGRDRENDYWLDRPNVSSLHARFMAGPAGTWVVEDLDSTNGVSVELRGVRHRIRKAVAVQPEQTVFFGSTPVAVTDLIEAASQLKSRPLPGAAADSAASALGGTAAAGSSPTSERAAIAQLSAVTASDAPPFTLHGPRMALWFGVGALLAVGLFVMLSLYGERLKHSLSSQPTGTAQPAPSPTYPGPMATPVGNVPQPSAPQSTVSVPPAAPGATRLPGPAVANGSPSAAQGTEAAQATDAAQATEPFDGLFWVLACDAGGEPAFRLGTACSVDGQHLLTTASVVEALRTLAAQGYPDQQIVHCKTGRQIPIRDIGVHPLFAQWLARSRLLEQQYMQLRDQARAVVQESADGGLSPALEESAAAGVPPAHPQLAEQMKQLAHEELALRDRMLCYDAGWLTVPPEHSLQAPALGPLAPTLARPLQSVRLSLTVIDAEDPYYDPTSDPQMQTIVGRVDRLVRPPDTDIGRMEIKLQASVDGWNVAGAPVLDAKGRVLGLYTQPSVPRDEPASRTDAVRPDGSATADLARSAARPVVARGDVVLAAVLAEVLLAAESSQE
ncbi:FHA domain-containing protein [Roseimaritima ulvae]|uniref:FHA domain-containing protein FhaB n=1 Tax=Roseimaritima ulvae TaxID=980254 RepID=A0A5B9QPX5_9BACT|nr:FHA domain-containing protein [Roseimaritima ulvae]QEG39720.1 FHA domain-containing protein FhaB [Roseimaritima ulvae]